MEKKIMDCCSVKNKGKSNNITIKNVCSTCGKTSKKVEYKTILMMLKFEQLKDVTETEYFFCNNSNCDVVYFSNEIDKAYLKDDVRLRVGIKETTKPKYVCYCFDITKKQIEDEIKLTGDSTIPVFITNKIQNKLCACNIKNPSGKCCLGDVKKIVNSNIQQKEK